MSSQTRLVVVALTFVGCKDPATEGPVPPPCYDVPGEVCEDTGEAGAMMGSETGGETGSGNPEALEPGECVFNSSEHKLGKQYNCFGELHTSLDFTIVGLFPTCEDLLGEGWCSQGYYFGYEPLVVACCGEYDTASKPEFQEFCIYDLFQQTCISLAKRLEYHVLQGHFGVYSQKGAKLQKYVANNQDACWDALFNNNVATLPFVETHWALPADFGLLENVVVHIEPMTRIDGVNAPSWTGEEWPICENAWYNDDTFFGNTDNQPPIGEIVAGVDLAGPVHAQLSGPVILGGAVSASVEFETICSSYGCPRAEFSYDAEGPGFGLEQLSLIGGSFAISNGTYSIWADRVQIRLYSQAAGSWASAGYEIPAGEAVFSVAGIGDGIANQFLAVNATSIWIVNDDDDLWRIDAFALEYEDGNHDWWTVTIEGSTWR